MFIIVITIRFLWMLNANEWHNYFLSTGDYPTLQLCAKLRGCHYSCTECITFVAQLVCEREVNVDLFTFPPFYMCLPSRNLFTRFYFHLSRHSSFLYFLYLFSNNLVDSVSLFSTLQKKTGIQYWSLYYICYNTIPALNSIFRWTRHNNA